MAMMTMGTSTFAITLSFPPLPLRLTANGKRSSKTNSIIIIRSKTSTKSFLLKRSSASALRAMLVLSCAAAVAFLRRKTRNRRLYNFQQALFEEATPSAMSATSQDENRPLKVVDMHLHVWAPPEQAEKFPYAPGQEPTVLGSVEVLLQAMREGGVDGALIVQPINHKFDHSYVSSVLQRFPDKFVGCCLADPSRGDGGVVELERLVTKEAYRAVRFNPYLWPSDEKMTNSIGKALFAKAGQLSIPVGFMCFKGLLLHIAEIEQLCSEFPETTVVLDHFGFCKPPINESEVKAWECLLGLSKFEKVYVKVSAFFRISREGYPYRDTWPLVKQLLATFGSKRLLWGSDFPFVIGECGYTNSRNIMYVIKEAIGMTDDDMEWVMGRTAIELFKGSWTS